MPRNLAANARFGHSGDPWLTQSLELGEWIQVDLGEVTMVTKIATQCGQQIFYCVTEYKVSYSLDGGYFKFYLQPSNNGVEQVGRK